MPLRTILLAAMVALVPIQVGCDFESFAFNSDRFKEDFQYMYDLKPGGKISLETFNGSVEIMSWEKPSVQITGAKYAAREEDMKDIKIDVQAASDSVRIRAIRPTRHGNMGARFTLRVPREVELERIVSSNGGMRVEDIKGNARLETSNGAVRIRKLDGVLDARTTNGGMDIDDIDGETTLRTSNGGIRADRIRGTFEASTTNSGINVRLLEVKPGSPIRLQTTNGGIDAAFEKLSDNPMRASTSNSGITLRLPADIKAQLRASTSNSRITSDFDVSASGSQEKNHLEGAINGGGPLIEATTSNGSIHLYKM